MKIVNFLHETAAQMPERQLIEHPKDSDPIYSTYPMCAVPVGETHLGELLKDADYVCPIKKNAARYLDHRDLAEAAATRQADRLNRKIELGIMEDNEKAARREADCDARTKQFLDLQDEEAILRVASNRDYIQRRGYSLELVAEETSANGRLLDPSNLQFAQPDSELLHSIETQAAKLGKPYDSSESLLPSKEMCWLATGLAGTAYGISYFVAAGQLEYENLGQRLGFTIAATGLGISLVYAGGLLIKVLWGSVRTAWELNYRTRWGTALAAIVLSTATVAVELSVEVHGLFAKVAMDRFADTLSEGHQASHIPASLLVVAGAGSFLYGAFSAVQGWLRTTSAIKNKLIKAQEEERIEALLGERENPAMRARLAAVNGVIALDAHEAAEQKAYSYRQSLVSDQIKQIDSRKVKRRVRGTYEEIRMQEQMNQLVIRVHNQGEQLLEAIPTGVTYHPSSKSGPKIGLWSRFVAWLKGLFKGNRKGMGR